MDMYFISGIVIGIITAIIHNKKGYSYITGFLWGFLFNILGLGVILIEKDKNNVQESNKKQLSMFQWLAIFMGVGIVALVIFLFVMTK